MDYIFLVVKGGEESGGVLDFVVFVLVLIFFKGWDFLEGCELKRVGEEVMVGEEMMDRSVDLMVEYVEVFKNLVWKRVIIDMDFGIGMWLYYYMDIIELLVWSI